MKKYLFGLGAMLVGAGLMFVLMHGEVIASDRDNQIVKKKMDCEWFVSKESSYVARESAAYCKIKDLTCVIVANEGWKSPGVGVSCFKTG